MSTKTLGLKRQESIGDGESADMAGSTLDMGGDLKPSLKYGRKGSRKSQPTSKGGTGDAPPLEAMRAILQSTIAMGIKSNLITVSNVTDKNGVKGVRVFIPDHLFIDGVLTVREK